MVVYACFIAQQIMYSSGEEVQSIIEVIKKTEIGKIREHVA